MGFDLFFACAALVSGCLRRWPFLDLLAVYLRRPCAGQAPTFLCLPQRKVGKRKRLDPTC